MSVKRDRLTWKQAKDRTLAALAIAATVAPYPVINASTNRKEHFKQLVREDTFCLDFHIPDTSEGGEPHSSTPKSPTPGTVNESAAVVTAQPSNAGSFSQSYSHKPGFSAGTRNKMREPPPRSFVKALRNAWKDSADSVSSDTADYLLMGNFHSTDVTKLIEGSAEEAEEDEGAFDRTEAVLLHAVWMAKKLAGCDDEETLQAARDLFRAIDVNDSGFIDVEELAVAFRSLKLQPTLAQLDYLVTKYDENGDGVIGFDEFRKMYIELAELHLQMVKDRRKLVRSVFDQLDPSDKGLITLTDLQRMFDDCPAKPTTEQIKSLVSRHLIRAAEEVSSPRGSRILRTHSWGNEMDAVTSKGSQPPHLRKPKDDADWLAVPPEMREMARYGSEGDITITFRGFDALYDELSVLHQSLEVSEEGLEQMWRDAVGGSRWKVSQKSSEWREVFRDYGRMRQVFISIEERTEGGNRLGYITQESLGRMLSLMDVHPTREELKTLLQKYDTNGQGILDFDCFFTLARDLVVSLDTEAEQHAPQGVLHEQNRSRDGPAPAGMVLHEENRTEQKPSKTPPRDPTLGERIEDAARAAVLGLPSQIRNLMGDMATALTTSPWVALTWLERFQLACRFEPYLQGSDRSEYGPMLRELSEKSHELQAMLSQVGSVEMPTHMSKVREVEVAHLRRAAGDILMRAPSADDGKDVMQLSDEEARIAVLSYALKIRQAAAEENQAAWDGPRGWQWRLQMCRDVMARQTKGKDRGAGDGMEVFGAGEGEIDFDIGNLGTHWGQGFGGASYKKKMDTYNQAASARIKTGSPKKKTKSKLLGNLLHVGMHSKKGTPISGVSAGGSMTSSAMGEEEHYRHANMGPKSDPMRLRTATNKDRWSPGPPSTGSTGGMPKSRERGRGSSWGGDTASPWGRGATGSKSPEGRGVTAGSRGGLLVQDVVAAPVLSKEDKQKQALSRAQRAEKLARLKSSALRVQLGARVAKMAKGAHEKILAELFRDALMLDPLDRSAADLKVMGKLFQLCPQLQGLPWDVMQRFCRVCKCQTFKDGEAIVSEGQESNAYYVIAVGFARVLVRSGAGEAADNMMEVSKLGPGRAFGELGLIYDQPRSATVVADGNLIATRVERAEYLELLADFHVQKLFRRIQDKLDFIRRFKAWSSFELRPQFALTYLLTHVIVPDGTVLFDSEHRDFDARYFQDKERYPPRPGCVVHFLQVGLCAVYSLARYKRPLAHEGEEEEEEACVSYLNPGCFFGGPATPSNVLRIVAKGQVELFETAIDDVLQRMGPDIATEMRDHCKAQSAFVADRVDKWVESKLLALSDSESARFAVGSHHRGSKKSIRRARELGGGVILPSVQMKQEGREPQSFGGFERPALGRIVSRPNSRAGLGVSMVVKRGSSGSSDLGQLFREAAMGVGRAVRAARKFSGGDSDLEEEGDLVGWMEKVERREMMIYRKKLYASKSKQKGKVGGAPQAQLQVLLRGGGASADPLRRRRSSMAMLQAQMVQAQMDDVAADAGDGKAVKAGQ